MEFLDVLSLSAITTTLGMFLCGIPTCLQISRRGTTEGISAVPFLMGVISALFWLRYGFLKADSSVITINALGLSLQTSYLLYYYYASRQKGGLNRMILLIALVSGGMMAYVGAVEGTDKAKAVDHLGLACLTFNIANFAAPLAGLRDVVRLGSTENLPFPLIGANLLVSAQWFLYGLLVEDVYIYFPNVVGIALALVQLSLFAIYPSKDAGKKKN